MRLAPKNSTRENPGAQEQAFDVTDCWPYGGDNSDRDKAGTGGNLNTL